MEANMGHFNALKSFDKLKSVGVSESQARAMIEVVEESSALSSDQVATKADVTALRAETKLGIAELRAETKLDIAALRGEMQFGFAELRAETKAGFNQVDVRFAEIDGKFKTVTVSINWLRRLFFGSTLLIVVNIAATFLHRI